MVKFSLKFKQEVAEKYLEGELSLKAVAKSECYYLNEYKSVEELKRDIISYIDYYNNLRIKEKLGGLSPIEYRLRQAA